MRNIFIIISLMLCFQVKAQEKLKGESNLQLKASYLGSIKYPGFKWGVEYPLKVKSIFKTKDSVFVKKEQSLTGNFGFYHHKNFHTNFFITAGYVWRRTNRHGWLADIEPQIGLSRTFIDGTTYRVKNNNEVEKITLAGDWFFSSKLSFSIGKEITKVSLYQNPLRVYARSSLLMLLPYNNFFYLRPTVEIGTILTLKNTSINTRIKNLRK